MLHKHRLSVALALGLAALYAPHARAELVPWSVQASSTPSAVQSDQGRIAISVTPDALTNQNSVLGSPTPTPIFFNLLTTGSLPTGATDTFNKGESFLLGISLKDVGSGQVGSVQFKGSFGGSISNTTNPLTVAFVAPTAEDLLLGGFDYHLTLVAPNKTYNYTPPGPAGSNSPGNIEVAVTVTGAASGSGTTPTGPTGSSGGPGPITGSTTPEPSAFLLAGIGAVALVVVRRQRLAKETALLGSRC